MTRMYVANLEITQLNYHDYIDKARQKFWQGPFANHEVGGDEELAKEKISPSEQ